jgi:F-type H+-transporting ATPase subunit delta
MSVGNAYAKALFETVGTQDAGMSDRLNEVESNFEQILALLAQSNDLMVVLGSPLTGLQEKMNVILSISEKFKFSKVFEGFLILLAKKKRLNSLEAIHRSWNLVRLEAEGGVAGQLVSAHPMDVSDVEGLAKAFSKKLGKKVTFRVTTNPLLLAGIQITVNGVTYDGSLRSQFQKLHDHLMVGAPSAHA